MAWDAQTARALYGGVKGTPIMKLYGYSHKTKGDLLELYEATISASPQQLRELAKFFEACASGIEQCGENWNHSHFLSEDERVDKNSPSLVVFNADAE